MSASSSNRLARETSPYLLQHAHNPVDWYPWGAEAWERAQREDRPVLLSIGYSACHWCHVMERESFTDPQVAALMNAHFVCIKVDREERPDVDDLYMAAALAINGQGGWPLNVFCTPDQEPFFAGTYFPPQDRDGRLGFPSLLARIAELWRSDRDSLFRQAGEVTDHLRKRAQPSPSKNVSAAVLDQACHQFTRSFDAEHGGFGTVPKFPPSQALRLLARQYLRTQNAQLLEMVTLTLDRMKDGGIYDQLGGGFARYSVDARWLVPHFEKMLYDNAQLARVYTEAWQLTQRPEYRAVASETLDYIIREMQSPEGGYYSATDADSEGTEGKYFVFTPKDLRAALEPEETRVLSAYYDVTEAGNWDGTNVLHVPRAAKVVARELKLDFEDFSRLLRTGREKLLQARASRVAPSKDDKVLTAWNGLMIGAMAEAGRAFGEPRFVASAQRAADFVVSKMRAADGGLLRTSRAGNAHIDAFLEDYAYLADGLLDLYEATGTGQYLDLALEFAERLKRDFFDIETGTFFTSSETGESLVVRRRESTDGALPNAAAVAARACLRLSRLRERPELAEVAKTVVRAAADPLERAPRAHASMLLLLDELLTPPVEVVFCAENFQHGQALRDAVGAAFVPHRMLAHVTPEGGSASNLEWARGKVQVDDKPTLYICRDNQCSAPKTSAQGVTEQLAAELKTQLDGRRPVLAAMRLSGWATAEGTARYFARRAQHPSAQHSLDDLAVSRVGFGTHRVLEEMPAHRQALGLALREGCNLLETAPSYGAGSSERAVGDALSEAVRSGAVRRDEVVVVTKLGVAEGYDAELLKKLVPPVQSQELAPGRLYSLDPRFLEAQLSASLARLNLEAVDVCLLHNPELLVEGAGASALSDHLTPALAFLETACERGQVRRYGVASNLLHEANSAFNLSSLLAARGSAGGSHFKVISLPFNAVERGAREGGVLEQAAAAGLSVLTQRPLNAITPTGLQRLVDAPELPEAPEFASSQSAVAQLEHEFRARLGAVLRAAPGVELATDRFFLWSERITPELLRDRETWNEFERQVLAPELPRMLGAIEQSMKGTQIGQLWRSWRERYTHQMEELVLAARHTSAMRSNARNRDVQELLRSHAPAARRQARLAQLAVWFASSEAEVTAALVGMRAPDYVHEALATLRWPEWDTSEM